MTFKVLLLDGKKCFYVAEKTKTLSPQFGILSLVLHVTPSNTMCFRVGVGTLYTGHTIIVLHEVLHFMNETR